MQSTACHRISIAVAVCMHSCSHCCNSHEHGIGVHVCLTAFIVAVVACVLWCLSSVLVARAFPKIINEYGRTMLFGAVQARQHT